MEQLAHGGRGDPERSVSAQSDAQPLRHKDDSRARELGVEGALVRGRHRLCRRCGARLLRLLLLTRSLDDARNLAAQIGWRLETP